MTERSTVLEVSRWSEVFETAASRRYGTLTWVALPVSFNSTGLQRLLDEFEGHKAAALYGCWNALLKVAATAPTRGVLAGQRGEPYTAGRLARLSGFPQDLFEELIEWCLIVGWLSVKQSESRLPDRTEQNRTEQNRTGPDRTRAKQAELSESTGPARPEEDLFFKALSERAKDKPQVLSLIAKPIQPLADSMTPTQPMQCWTGAGWNDDFISMHADVHRRNEGRAGVWTWYRRQLASPDPVAADRTAAGAVCVLALAEQAAHRPGLKNRPAWFRAQLRPKNVMNAVTELNSKYFNAAAKFVAEELAK